MSVGREDVARRGVARGRVLVSIPGGHLQLNPIVAVAYLARRLTMNSVIWRTPAGRDRLENWYERFRSSITAPTESIRIDTPHGSSHVLVGGPTDGPPLVCLHAMRTGASFLLSTLDPLLAKYRVYAPDLPGQSVRGLDRRLSLTDDSLAQWLFEVVNGLRLDRFDLLGASWGGFVGRLGATAAPDRVKRLALLVPAGIANGSHLTGLLRMAWPMIRYRLRPSEHNLKQLLSPIMTTWDEDWAGFMATSLQDMKMDPRIPPLATDDELRRLTMPTLVLAGDRDISFPADRIVQRLSTASPNIEVEVMRDCKHCPPTTAQFRTWICERLDGFFGGERGAKVGDAAERPG